MQHLCDPSPSYCLKFWTCQYKKDVGMLERAQNNHQEGRGAQAFDKQDTQRQLDLFSQVKTKEGCLQRDVKTKEGCLSRLLSLSEYLMGGHRRDRPIRGSQ